ncbi:MAG: hypothetical protein CMO66_06480 [Verrucomicrobiales bacterium]|nr:hypothetical protein [Verrucomicrobiales bacterium]
MASAQMSPTGFLFILIGIAAAIVFIKCLRSRRRTRRHATLMNRPIPPAWQKYLEDNLPLYNPLPEDLKRQVEGHTQILVEDLNWEGHNGLIMTDEIRVTIAGQASFLILNQKRGFPATLRSVIVYPGAYQAKSIKPTAGGLHTEGKQKVLGQSWDAGVIVLAWDNTKHSAANAHDGHNLVLHEFAHQLDQASGAANGTPILRASDRYRNWWQAMAKTYSSFLDETERGKKTVMDDYGATNPAEFFAVATETFFEKPRQLRKRRPELYHELCTYYQTDPLDWRS